MAFKFHPDDGDATGFLRRIAAEELGAISAGAGVHDARKRVKKLRAALRLVRPGFPAAASEGTALRDAAQGLSARRDAEVMLATLDRLVAPDTAQDLRAALAARVAATAGDDTGFAGFLAAIAAVRDRAAGWTVRGKTARVLAQGLARTRERGLHAMALARDAPPEAEALHDWRKRAKDLWYQARLFQPVWPEAMAPIVAASGDLGEMLGDHHDLVVFRALLAEPGLAPMAHDLPDRALARMADLRAAARPLSARLFAGDPGALARQWVDWRRLWQKTR